MSKIPLSNEPIHMWFSLTYANYFVCQRSILQSMPIKWQREFVRLLEELDEATAELPDYVSDFWVRTKSGNKFVNDKYRDYERGRRVVKLKRLRGEK